MLSGARIPAGAESVRLTLTAPASASGRQVALRLEGSAPAGGRELRRVAVPAEDMTQAFAYRHLVPSREWLVSVTGPNRRRAAWGLPTQVLRIPSRGKTALNVAAPLGRFGEEIRLALNDPPEGLSIESVTPSPNGLSVVLKSDLKLAAGKQGNLIFEAFLERTGDNKQVRRVAIGALPAVAFEVTRQ
jgi:hypothetical protein